MKTFLYWALLLLALSNGQAMAKTPGEVEVGSQLREAKMQGLAGPSAKLSEFRGKPLIINVWASWCAPCRLEMASLDRLAQRYGGKQFNVIGADHIPLTLLVNAQGQVLLKVHGTQEWDGPQALDLIGKTLRLKL
jgi:thiol-disulfide isomerase/thioredoxin